MKLYTTFIVVAFSFTFSNAQIKYSEAEKEGLRGSVKKVSYISAPTDFAGSLDTMFVNAVIEYTPKGWQSSVIRYNSKKNPTPLVINHSTFDDRDFRIRSEGMFKGKKANISLFKYDDKGRITLDQQVDSLESVIQKKDRFSYPDDKTMIQNADSKTTGTYQIVSKLDNWGNEIERKRDNPSDPKRPIMFRKYTYDKSGRNTSWVAIESDKSEQRTTYEYNEQGDLIKETMKSYKGSVSVSETMYEYDKHGSWIKKTGVRNGVPSKSSEYRIIEYYDN